MTFRLVLSVVLLSLAVALPAPSLLHQDDGKSVVLLGDMWFPNRIDGIAVEFMKQSPGLKELFQKFDRCQATTGCKVKPILKKRNEVLAQEWPEVYDRLMWGPWNRTRDAQANHAIFLEAQASFGARRLRDECAPIISFYQKSEGTRLFSVALLEGFSCSTAPPARLGELYI